jgi:L-iditol 2-dehydrogenase
LHLQYAWLAGAGSIIATDVNRYRMEAAKRFGADAVIEAHDDVPARVKELNDGRPADLAIVCAGELSAYEQALASLDRGGRLLCFAPTRPGVALPVPINDFWRNGITILPSYGGSPRDIMTAMELIRARRVPVEEMITHRLPLEEAAEGFRLVAEASESIKVILLPHGR